MIKEILLSCMAVVEIGNSNPAQWDVPMPGDHLAYVAECCEEYGVPAELVLALIERESGFQEDAVSETEDYGYMQINRCNFKSAADNYGLYPKHDPFDNIKYGIIFLSTAYRQYESWDKALMIYAGGPSVIGCAEWKQGYTEKTVVLIERAKEIKKEGGTVDRQSTIVQAFSDKT